MKRFVFLCILFDVINYGKMFVVSGCCSLINSYLPKYRGIVRNIVCHAFEMKREALLIAGFPQGEKSFQNRDALTPLRKTSQDLHHPQILLWQQMGQAARLTPAHREPVWHLSCRGFSFCRRGR